MKHKETGQEKRVVLKRGKQGIFRVIFGRTGVVAFLLLAQFLFVFSVFQRLEQYVPYFWVGNVLLGEGIVIHLIHSCFLLGQRVSGPLSPGPREPPCISSSFISLRTGPALSR